MTAGVVVSPLLGAALVNGLCGALVLNGVACPCACHEFGSVRSARCQHCAGTVGGRGSVAPSVTPGQHLAVITTRTDPDLQSDSPHMDGSWQWSWRKYPDRPGRAGARFDAEASAVLREGVHLGSVIGSVTATTPALPIVAKNHDLPSPSVPHFLVSAGRQLDYFNGDGWEKLWDDQVWLGDLGDLVGRSLVLIDNPTTTDAPNGCPACRGGSKPWTPYGCATCLDNWATAPVPLPDDVDLTEGTIVEVDL